MCRRNEGYQSHWNTTNLDDESEAIIKDVWYNNPDEGKELSGVWTGQTVYELLHPKPEPGFEWQSGRHTKIQKTERPPNIMVDVWG